MSEKLGGDEFRRLVPADARVQKLAGGMKFTEGPVWVPRDGGYLVFSDIPADELKKWTRADGVTTFRAPSRQANGNTLDREGHLVTCEHAARRVTRTDVDGNVAVLVDSFEGKKFNSPNDVVVKSDGSIWFTDPPYGLPKGAETQMPKHYVFRLDPEALRPTVVADDFDMPNGLCFSPDEKRLYIADSGKPKHIRVFDVRPDGTLDGGAVFCEIDQGVPDGIRCDSEGNLWSSAGDGVQVFSPAGTRIGRIAVPESPANLCFGGDDGQTLFMTARTSLYAIKVNARGATWPA